MNEWVDGGYWQLLLLLLRTVVVVVVGCARVTPFCWMARSDFSDLWRV
jgi:hypothetical protein